MQNKVPDAYMHKNTMQNMERSRLRDRALFFFFFLDPCGQCQFNYSTCNKTTNIIVSVRAA